jgi:hypothetical protein
MKVEKMMPTFSFRIPKIDFYINTPALSVSLTTDKFRSYESDGVFYILNSNTKTIYFNDIVFDRARVREASSRLQFAKIKVELTNEYDNEFKNKHYREYNVFVNGYLTGLLTIISEMGVFGSNMELTPLTKLKIWAKYEVKNLGVLNKHYYGKSTNNPEKRVGVIDFTFKMNCFSDKNSKNMISDDVVISTILVNT